MFKWLVGKIMYHATKKEFERDPGALDELRSMERSIVGLDKSIAKELDALVVSNRRAPRNRKCRSCGTKLTGKSTHSCPACGSVNDDSPQKPNHP